MIHPTNVKVEVKISISNFLVINYNLENLKLDNFEIDDPVGMYLIRKFTMTNRLLL